MLYFTPIKWGEIYFFILELIACFIEYEKACLYTNFEYQTLFSADHDNFVTKKSTFVSVCFARGTYMCISGVKNHIFHLKEVSRYKNVTNYNMYTDFLSFETKIHFCKYSPKKKNPQLNSVSKPFRSTGSMCNSFVFVFTRQKKTGKIKNWLVSVIIVEISHHLCHSKFKLLCKTF